MQRLELRSTRTSLRATISLPVVGPNVPSVKHLIMHDNLRLAVEQAPAQKVCASAHVAQDNEGRCLGRLFFAMVGERQWLQRRQGFRVAFTSVA